MKHLRFMRLIAIFIVAVVTAWGWLFYVQASQSTPPDSGGSCRYERDKKDFGCSNRNSSVLPWSCFRKVINDVQEESVYCVLRRYDRRYKRTWNLQAQKCCGASRRLINGLQCNLMFKSRCGYVSAYNDTRWHGSFRILEQWNEIPRLAYAYIAIGKEVCHV